MSHDLVVLGLSLASAWGNGHATTYRSLLKAYAARGHSILFLERDVPWYRGPARDLVDPAFCRLAFYDDLAGLDRKIHVRERDNAAERQPDAFDAQDGRPKMRRHRRRFR